MRQSGKRVLRRSVEVNREESKGSEMNWVSVLRFPGRMVFSRNDQATSRTKLTQWTRRMS